MSDIQISEGNITITLPDAPFTSTEILCWVMGWQGGTVHQVAKRLNITTDAVLKASGETLRDLCRLAQELRRIDVITNIECAKQSRIYWEAQMPELYAEIAAVNRVLEAISPEPIKNSPYLLPNESI